MADCILETITLSSEAVWVDEFSWSDVKSRLKRTLHGTSVISSNQVVQNQGRPITLAGDGFWINYTDLQSLQTLLNSNTLMSYQHHDGRTFNVHFRYWDPPPIEAVPLITDEAAPLATSEFRLIIKLVIV